MSTAPEPEGHDWQGRLRAVLPSQSPRDWTWRGVRVSDMNEDELRAALVATIRMEMRRALPVGKSTFEVRA